MELIVGGPRTAAKPLTGYGEGEASVRRSQAVCGHDICVCEPDQPAWPAPTVLIDAEGSVIEAAGRLRDAVAAGLPADALVADVVRRIDALDGLFAKETL